MYIFNHIPKTGGTTMYRIIERLIVPHRISTNFTINQETPYSSNIIDCDQYLVIFGHIGVAWNDILAPQRQWMTMLRDPVDRIISQYYFWRNNISKSPHLRYVHLAQTLSLAEFVKLREELVLQGIQNVQTWQLADDFCVPYRSVAARDALETAKRNLSTRFAFIGIFDDYAGSVKRLCRLLGKATTVPIPTENRTFGRPAVNEIDKSVVAAIRAQNWMDQELYEYAKAIAGSQA